MLVHPSGVATHSKKADVAEHPEVFHHVGLLVNGPSGRSRVALQLVIRQITASSAQSGI